MLLWDHLAYSTQSIGDTAYGMISCWVIPELQRTPAQQAQCTEILYGELVSVAAFSPMLLVSNLVLLFVFVVPLKWAMIGKMTAEKLQSKSVIRQWSIHTFVILQRSMYVRFATMMIQGTELFNIFLRMVGYKVRALAAAGLDMPSCVCVCVHVQTAATEYVSAVLELSCVKLSTGIHRQSTCY